MNSDDQLTLGIGKQFLQTPKAEQKNTSIKTTCTAPPLA